MIFDQGCLPLAFVKPMTNCKAAVSVTLDWGPHRVLSAGPAEPWFLARLLLLPLTLFQPGLLIVKRKYGASISKSFFVQVVKLLRKTPY